jgi:phosphoglycerate dehydrogenase-like enzyme
MKLRIWCNNDFGPRDRSALELLQEGTARHQLFIFPESENGLAGEPSQALADSAIAFGYPDPQAILASQTVRWVQLNSAGYTNYDVESVKSVLRARGTLLSNSSAVYDEPCAQHLLAMMLSLARNLPQALDNQSQQKAWPMQELRAHSPLLNGQSALILGFGSIARRVAELLQPLHMNLMAVRRTVTGDEPIPVIEVSRVDELLPRVDHVINILPANDETLHFLNAERFAKLKTGAIVYNIGRGATLDQAALIRSLESGKVKAAYLDVTDPEPLPPDNPLWTTPNCFITPHTAGGHTNEKERQVKHFLNNLQRFENDEPLINRVL